MKTIVVLAAVALAAAACGGGSNRAKTIDPTNQVVATTTEGGSRPGVTTGALPPTNAQAPTLTADQTALAKDIAMKDRRFARALVGKTSQVTTVWPWLREDQTVIGARVSVAIGATATIETDWPVIQYEKKATGYPYREYVVHFRADNVTSFDILVDFARGRVVEIQPDQHAVVSHASEATPVIDTSAN